MNSLTEQEWCRQVKSLAPSKIKELIHRQRLKFTPAEIAFYLTVLLQQIQTQVHYQRLYRQLQTTGQYSLSYLNFMENLNLLAPIVKYLFQENQVKLKVKPSKMFNIIDSTLILTKQEKSIKSKDYAKHRVTLRKKKPICGVKALVMLNRQGAITFARCYNINASDLNFLKKPEFLQTAGLLQGFLLADRGFNCKLVRERIATANQTLNKNFKPTALISPYHYKEKKSLSAKARKLYKRRWKIEEFFQQLKDEFGSYKLNFKKNLRINLKLAGFYFHLINYNLSFKP